MAVVLARIDDRLIHGQVMTSWVNFTGANKIIVIDDVTAKDSFLCMTIKSLVPSNIRAEVYTREQSVEAFLSQKESDKIIVLAKTPEPYVYLQEHGVSFAHINIGGMGIKKGRKTIYKNISASDEELAMLKALADNGARVYIQMVAENPKMELDKII